MAFPLAGEAGGGSTRTAVPRNKGFPRRYCQGLPGCDASSVLSLDIASRSRYGAILQPKAFRFVKHEHVPEKLKTKYPKNSSFSFCVFKV